TNFVRDAVVIAYCVNEMLSIVENMGLMGVPIPEAITKAIEILKKKSETEDKNGGKE
ncbi:phage holin family protein, partial [Eubacterium callanderi]